ncbi:histidine kinase [Leptospira fletcheri]|uniref:histidine kinase n=1 Tax=Leptospira fletcheri TaxID=2484981 RepID=A0A4R9GBK9_9LEPT|nr:sensor histidine kinase [Leptospira fletcheri]TGK08755.1 histidine kinase [Leptospira fletcheri]
MQTGSKKTYLTLFALALLLTVCKQEETDVSYQPNGSGTLDLSKREIFLGSKTIPLDGQWNFYWNRLIPVVGDGSNPFWKGGEKARVPEVWNHLSFQGKRLDGIGFASYRLKLFLPPDSQPYAISIPDLGTSYEFYANGLLIASAGKVGKDPETSTAGYKPQIAVLSGKNLDLVLHISNFQNRWGGFWSSVRVGHWSDVLSERERSLTVDICLAMIAAIMSVYNLFLYFFRRKEPAPLLFSLHCFLILCRILTTGERLGYRILGDSLWEYSNKLEYFSVYASAPTLYAFLNRYCPTEFWRRFGLWLTSPYYIICALVLFFPNRYYTLTLFPASMYALFVTMPTWAILLSQGIRRNLEGAAILMLGYAVITLCTIGDILNSMGLFRIHYLIPYGQIFLIVCYSLLISKIFSVSFRKSTELSSKMKSLVSYTREIMLSSSYRHSAHYVLSILSETDRKGSRDKIHVYLEDSKSSSWRKYSTDGERVSEDLMSDQEMEKYLGCDPSALEKPFIKEKRFIVPVRHPISARLLLDIPLHKESLQDSSLDWVQGIADAFAFSIQNINRQDRDKLAIIGELSAEIVHDIGHHIMILRQHLRNLGEYEEKRKQAAVRQAEKETEALSNLSLDILDVSKNRIILDLQNVKIGDYFREIRDDLRHFFLSLEKEMKLTCTIQARGKFKLDPFRIRRLIFNLAKNAAEATPQKGLFSIRVEKESNILYLIFEDNGSGFNSDLKERLYEPMGILSSSKPHGAGLGLSIIGKIVSAHGGEILIDSGKGRGSRFTILLPESGV